MSLKLATNLEFIEIAPGCCGMPFMMLESHYDARAKDHKTFWCPNCGCSRHFTAESEEQKLRRRLELEKNRRASAEHEAQFHKNVARAQKAAKTRIKNRIARGVCP